MKVSIHSLFTLLGLVATVPVSAATLARAPATGTDLTNHQANTAVVEVRGQFYYSKSAVPPPAPSDYYVYGWTTHGSSACGNSSCEQDGDCEFYYRYKCNSGCGTAGDGSDVTFYWDLRVYAGATFTSPHPYPNFSGSTTLTFDGDELQGEWSGGTSGLGTNQAVSYKVGAWQGGAGSWSATTSTDPL